MDIKRIIPLAFILGLFVWGGIKIKRGFTALMDIDVHGVETGQIAMPNNVTRDGFAFYLRAPVPMPPNVELNGVSKECESYVSGIESLDLLFFHDPGFKVSYQQLKRPNPACSISELGVQDAETLYLKNCFLGNPEKSALLKDDCVHALYDMRSALTHMLYKNKRLADIDSLPVLTQFLYAEVNDTLNLNKMQAITDQMIEVKPFKAVRRLGFYVEVKKAAVLSKSKTLREQDEIWQGIRNDYDKLRSQFAFEVGESEYLAFVQTRGFDPLLTVKYANSLLATNPTGSWGLFISAYGHWLNDDRSEAFSDLRKAVQADPGNDVYHSILSKLMNNPSAGEATFAPGLKLGVSPQDFDK